MLRTYEAMRPLELEGPNHVLEAGIGHEREYVRFWGKRAKKRR